MTATLEYAADRTLFDLIGDERPAIALADDEIIIDCFAGGGGASTGIEWATGRSPDEGINHSATALAIHAANHPKTRHWHSDIWEVDPLDVAAGRRVGLLWLSPDCTHFSRAKGGKPLSKKVRVLAHVAVRYAKAVRPRVIILENVEEFLTWGPISRKTGKPDPARKSQSFRGFVRQLRREGYAVEWRLLRGCDFGAPTIRKRLFFVARCDGVPIRWPVPTHGKGRPQPWRTAAECIDWSLPCPSIFLTKAEARAIGVKRPLAEATMRRIARGIRKFVIDAADPFIVEYHSAKRAGDDRVRSVDEPLPTQTVENRFGLAMPFVTKFHEGSTGQPLTDPLATVTSNSFEKRPGCAIPLGLVVPLIVPMQRDNQPTSVEDPLQTVTTQGNKFNLVVPTLIQTGFGEDKKRNEGRGQEPRVPGLDKPLGTVVAGGSKHALVAAFLAKHYGDTGQRPGSGMDEPVSTVTSCDHNALVTAHIQRDFGTSTGHAMDAPMGTVTADASGHCAIVAEHLVQFNRGTDGQPLDEPLRTVMGRDKFAEVRAFLTTYYGTNQNTGNLREPVPTVTAKDRLGLVTVHGTEYVIADIGMRMLSPRELATAQGFPKDYQLDVALNGKRISKTAQTAMVGNSVNPHVACALVQANFGAWVAQEVAA